MQDSKRDNLAGDSDIEAPSQAQAADQVTDDSSDADGWQQYRRWISKAPAPRSRRSSVDPSLYTWKGYRTWSEQIRRNWSDS